MVRTLEEYKLNAEPIIQLRLLELQAVDSRIDQLNYQKAHSPAATELAEVTAAANTARDTAIAAQTLVSDLTREQAKADADVDQVRVRAAKDRELMDSGTIASAKQLESLGHELESLARRQSELEDVELEVMERLDGAQRAHAQLAAEHEVLVAKQSELEAALADLFAQIDADLALAAADRDAIAVEIPEDLLKLYEKVRKDHGGVGAAQLHRGQCQGCHMQLTPTDIESIRAAKPDEVLRCEECRRILVRTENSGL